MTVRALAEFVPRTRGSARAFGQALGSRPRDMGGHRTPCVALSVFSSSGFRLAGFALAGPDVGVSARTFATIRQRVARTRMDYRDIAEASDQYVVCLQVANHNRLSRLEEECGAVDQGSVGIGTNEIIVQDFVEPADVAVLHRGDVVAVEYLQDLDIGHRRVSR